MLVFSLTLYWLPPARLEWAFEWGYLRIPTLRTVLLPTVTLSALYIAYIARLTRSGLVETLRQDYIRTARAKGLSEWRIVTVHALARRHSAGGELQRTGSGVSHHRDRGGRADVRHSRSGRLLHRRGQ